MIDPIFYAAVTFLVALNPIGLVPIFIGLTAKATPDERARIAARASIIAGALLIGFLVGGQLLFDALGIHLSAFRVAGGLILSLTALNMVLAPTADPGDEDTGQPHDVALFPLAMPHISGPATIMSAILLTDNDTVPIAQQAAIAVALLAMVGLCYLAMRAADPLQRLLGRTGANVVTRVMGLILLSVGVEHVLAGLRVELGLGGN